MALFTQGTDLLVFLLNVNYRKEMRTCSTITKQQLAAKLIYVNISEGTKKTDKKKTKKKKTKQKKINLLVFLLRTEEK